MHLTVFRSLMLAVALTTTSAAVGLTDDEVMLTYNRAFPYYVESCMVSQINPRPEHTFLERGGRHGHAVAFLHGACLVEDSDIPQLRLCDTSEQVTADAGIGISVNPRFANVNWMAIPGRNYFFTGGISRNETLTLDRYEALHRELVDSDFYRGIEFNQRFNTPAHAGRSDKEAVAYDSISTDVALTLGRNAYCARLPVTKAMMDKIIGYLNSRNQQMRGGTYHWDMLTDNCSHLIHNALAHAKIFSPKRTSDTSVNCWGYLSLLNPYNLSVPGNGVVQAAEAGNKKLGRLYDIYRDSYLYNMFEEYGKLVVGPGAITTYYPQHPLTHNQVFAAAGTFNTLDIPLLFDRRKASELYFSEKRYTSLLDNLKHYKEVYSAAIADASHERPGRTCDFWLFDRESYTRFYQRFVPYLREELAKVNSLLGELAGKPSSD